MTGTIDLNADLGEGEAHEAEIMALVSSCNIACGGHAGDAASMRAALALAKQHSVAAGAHPSYPDRENFGRRTPETVSPGALRAALAQQVEDIKAVADALAAPLHHLKPHGALYNDAARDRALADLIAGVCATALPGAHLVGPPASELAAAASTHGLSYIAEGFADRAYAADGSLVPRTQPGAILQTDDARTSQALDLALNHAVKTQDGSTLAMPVQTICLHGDSPGALASARAIRAALIHAGLTIKTPS